MATYGFDEAKNKVAINNGDTEWVAFGGHDVIPGSQDSTTCYYRLKDGFVTLTTNNFLYYLAVNSGSTARYAIDTLPEEVRPDRELVFPVIIWTEDGLNPVDGYMIVDTLGVVELYSRSLTQSTRVFVRFTVNYPV